MKLLERLTGRERFDAFIQKYISTYKFQSLTTEAFVTFLQQELPDVVKKVDLDEWLYKPGLAKDAPQFQSKLYDDLVIAIDNLNEGTLPTQDQIANWIPEQVRFFLGMLPEVITIENCRDLENLFGLKDSRDYVPICFFQACAIRSGYQEILPYVEGLISSSGELFPLGVVFRALVKAEWSRELARPLFERYRERYHPISIARIESILEEAGL